MLSRNIESLFWIGRYMERIENHARLLDVFYQLQMEVMPNHQHPSAKWMKIVETLGQPELYEQVYGSYNEEDVLYYVTIDKQNVNSLISCVCYARNNVRTLRENLPTEIWEVMNGFYLWLQSDDIDTILKLSPHRFFGRIKEWSTMFHGVLHSVMPRGNEWRFIESGRYLERGENTLRMIRAAHTMIGLEEAIDNIDQQYPLMQAILRSVSGYQIYRRFYADGFKLSSIVEFFMVNQAFPRSIAYALRSLEYHLQNMNELAYSTQLAHERMLRQLIKLQMDISLVDHHEFTLGAHGATFGMLINHIHQFEDTFAQTFFRNGEISA